MFKIIPILTIICLSFSVQAQSYKEIDHIVGQYPKHFETPELLAFAIQNDFSKKDQQVRALFYWMANNIHYEVNSSFENDKRYLSTYELNDFYLKRTIEVAKATLRTSKASCEGYAQLFNQTCAFLDIQSEVIGGYTINNRLLIGTNPVMKNHAWNAYFMNDKWHLVDVTWSAGYENLNTKGWVKEVDDSYYNIAPSRLIKTHFPVLPNWQLIEKPISKEEFFANPIFYDYYFKTVTRLSPSHTGIITIDEGERTISINFDEVSTEPIAYRTRNTKFDRTVRLKKMKDGGYQGKIKLIRGYPSFLTLIENGHTIVEFKVDTIYNHILQEENN